MGRKLRMLMAMAFPWLVLLLDDDPVGAFLALVMQGTIIGWIPASLWAMRVVRESEDSTSSSLKPK